MGSFHQRNWRQSYHLDSCSGTGSEGPAPLIPSGKILRFLGAAPQPERLRVCSRGRDHPAAPVFWCRMCLIEGPPENIQGWDGNTVVQLLAGRTFLTSWFLSPPVKSPREAMPLPAPLGLEGGGVSLFENELIAGWLP